jgi:hypothetical protein
MAAKATIPPSTSDRTVELYIVDGLKATNAVVERTALVLGPLPIRCDGTNKQGLNMSNTLLNEAVSDRSPLSPESLPPTNGAV